MAFACSARADATGILTEDGRAQIWRMKRPDVLLSGGSLEDAGLELWATVPLRVNVEGEEEEKARGSPEIRTPHDGCHVGSIYLPGWTVPNQSPYMPLRQQA